MQNIPCPLIIQLFMIVNFSVILKITPQITRAQIQTDKRHHFIFFFAAFLCSWIASTNGMEQKKKVLSCATCRKGD